MGGEAHRGKYQECQRSQAWGELTSCTEPHGDLPSDQLESLPGGELTLKATEETTGKLSVTPLTAQSHRAQFTKCKAELKLPYSKKNHHWISGARGKPQGEGKGQKLMGCPWLWRRRMDAFPQHGALGADDH